MRDQVDSMDGATYFALLAELMKTNPPAAADTPMVATMAKIGLIPGQTFDPTKQPLNRRPPFRLPPDPHKARSWGC